MEWENVAFDIDPRLQLAPKAWEAVAALQHATLQAAPDQLLGVCQARMAMLLRAPQAPGGHGLAPLPAGAKAAALGTWPTSSLFDETERAALTFTEQFVMDVAGTSDDHRQLLFAALEPDQIGPFVMGLFVCDYLLRTEIAVSRLFFEAAGSMDSLQSPPLRSAGNEDLSACFDTMLRTIALLDSLDPVTTELVRLRGARTHNCRICQSTRSVQAIRAGATEDHFEKVDRFETADLSERHKCALRLTDKIITQPTEIGPELAGQVRSWFTPDETMEMVLDILRNSAQKVAVSMDADAPNVTEGFDFYDIDSQGEVLFGQPTPTSTT